MEWSNVFESASGPSSFSPFIPTPFESVETVQVTNEGGAENETTNKAAEIRASSPDSKKVDKTSTGKKGVPWTEAEHQLFLMGLNRYGKGEWKNISQHYVVTKTPTQVASHAQKFFRRQANTTPPERRRRSIHDIQTINSGADSFSSWPPQPPCPFGHFPPPTSCDLQSPPTPPPPPPPPFPAATSFPYGLVNFSNNELVIDNFAGTSMVNQPSAANSHSYPDLNS